MDGRNSSGCKISLLNEEVSIPKLLARHSSLSTNSSSTPTSPAPSLTRSSSSDSGFSPLTPPTCAFDQTPRARKPAFPHHQQYYLANHHYSKTSNMDDQNASMYPPIPDPISSMPAAYPMPPQMSQQVPIPQLPQNDSNSPASEPSRVSTVSVQSNNKGQQKKNQYPCPMAKQVGCTDFFTTSGHAARHAKKHTGKKDAFCPECNKAFTRKDNMEQHRRTHQNGRGTSRQATEDAKIKKTTKQPVRKPTIKAESQLEAAIEQQLAEHAQVQQVAQQAQAQSQAQQTVNQAIADPQALLLPAGAGPYFLNPTLDSGPIPAMPMAMPDLNIRPPLNRSSFTSNLDYVTPSAAIFDPENLHYNYPSPGLSNGLDSLALASEHRRLSEKARSSRSPSAETPKETP